MADDPQNPQGTTNGDAGTTDTGTATIDGLPDPTTQVADGQTGGDQQTATDQTGGDKGGDDKPIEYEAFRLPEGLEFQPQVMEKFTAIGKEHRLPQAAMQAMVDYQLGLAQEAEQAAQAQAQEAEQANEAKLAKWDQEWADDPKHDENEVAFARGLKLADADTAQLLTKSWLGKHPGIRRLVARAGALVADDSFGGAPAGGSGEKTAGELWYS